MKKTFLFFWFWGAGMLATLAPGLLAQQAHAQTATAPAIVSTADVANVPTAEAATADAAAPSDDCALQASAFTALQAIQENPNLTYAQELSQELALRKQLLSATITCAINDAQALQTALNAAPATSTAATNIQSQLSQKLNDAITFYNLESSKLAGAGIKGTESIAKEVAAWRTANYSPLEGDVNNFLLWSSNQALFDTAQNRLTQTKQVVAFIENAAQNDDLSASLQAAQSSLMKAQSDNTTAGAELAELQDPSQSLALIQQSLQELASTYQNFTDLNTLIQTLLPTNQ